METITTHSPEETMRVASRLGKGLKKGACVALTGELGSGKTVFVKGLARGLGIKDYDHVNSPSFVILKVYHGKKNLYHFDAYRLNQKSFSETVDYERYFYSNGVSVIEWADRIKDALPAECLKVTIEHKGQTERKLYIEKKRGQATS